MASNKKCKECGEDLNDVDRRWVAKHTLYCRECVCEPVFKAMTALHREEKVARAKAAEGKETE